MTSQTRFPHFLTHNVSASSQPKAHVSNHSLLQPTLDALLNSRVATPLYLLTCRYPRPDLTGGMDLNPVFTSLSSFSHSPNSPTHAPTLFNLSGVRLVHGWLADPQSRAYSVLERVKDYDAATTLIVGCDAVMGGQLVESVGGGGNEDGGGGEGGEERSAEERQMIEDGEYLHLNLGTPSNA